MSRKTIRKEIASIFEDTEEFNQVTDYAPVSYRGMDKLLAVYTARTKHRQETKHLEHNFYAYVLSVMVKRSGSSTEDDLDDLHDVIRSTVKDNQVNDNWDLLSLEEDSQAGFTENEGSAYRVEAHILLVKETT